MKDKNKQISGRSIMIGLGSTLLMLSFYFVVLYLFSGSLSHLAIQWQLMGKWVLILAFGFGVQMVFIAEMRRISRQSCKTDKKLTATSAGTSASAMVACCAHHLADIIPFIGLTGAASFMSQYQMQFIWVGLLATLLGLFYVFYHYQRLIRSYLTT